MNNAEVEDPKSDHDEEEEDLKENSELSSNDDKKPELYLSPFEAFYLSFGLGCLVVREEEEEKDKLHLTIDALWRKFNDLNPNFCEQYAVYHHFRSKGWVVKDGTKFGVEFLLYQEGPAFFHAQYSVKIVSANSAPMTWKTLSGLNRVTESSSKELLLAEISYWDDISSAEYCSELKNVEEMRKKSSKIVQKLLSVCVTENIVKRWVPNQERDQN